MKIIFLTLFVMGIMEIQAQNNCKQQIQRMELYEGSWEYEIKVRPTPDSEEIIVSASATNMFIYQGKFLKMEGKSKVGDITGESVGYIGFDDLKCKFTYYIISSIAHDATYAEGIYNEDDGKFIFEGRNINRMNLKERGFRIEMMFMEDGTFKQMNFFESPDGTEYLGVTVNGRRIG